ncbi:hypothetical protein Bca52824_047911 [Brassica carinata]|uniref:Uncharacterized protein n=1 Tax=Brassica carinata TaxID=52824 RepID=A0A8X7RHY7_BRACI|nr:hypothetical protein Bca52824_047911 [Brassica carinata]
MGGKRKRNTVKPNSSRVTQRPATLPAQYDFIPRDPSPSIPPVLPKNKPLLRTILSHLFDYPPQKAVSETNFPPSQSAPCLSLQLLRRLNLNSDKLTRLNV